MCLCEIPITLVLTGYGHNRAGSITHQHIIGDVQGYGFSGKRVKKKGPGIDTAFIEGAFGRNAIGFTCLADGFDKICNLLPLGFRCYPGYQGMFRRKHCIGHSERSIGARGKHTYGCCIGRYFTLGVTH